MSAAWPGVIRKYAQYLPVSSKTPVVTLLEGNTPLIECVRLNHKVGQGVRLFLKYEGLNPTGSFKDRGMTLAISKAKEEGSQMVMCASTGNTSASAAAYASRADMKCFVLIPSGNIALGKLAQALVHGAQVLAIKGNFDQALEMVKTITKKHPVTLVNSLNPYRIEGQKSAAFEICDVLGKAPDFHALPVGNAGNITAYWKGYKEYKSRKVVSNLPVMLGFQAAGSAPIVLGRPVKDPHTLATAIKIGNPASWKTAVAARDESKGLIKAVTDEEIVQAYNMLACLEGVFCEPASAASVAGVLKLSQAGYFDKPTQKGKKPVTIVCTLTGHGLKDPDRAIAVSPKPKEVKADLKSVLNVLGF